MAMVVKNNMSAVRTLNTLNTNSSALQKSLAKVSSGMKINSAQDDASGYAISERMRVQIRSLDQANQNTQNASSLMKTAEGAVSSTVEILKSLKEKAINAATDTNTDQDRATIQKELDQFIDQIDDNALTTFNGKYLVDGSKSQSGAAVATSMTNQSLSTDTTGSTALTALKNRNGDSLEISSADYVTASYVQNGRTYTTKFRVGNLEADAVTGRAAGDQNTLDDVFKRLGAVGTDAGAASAFAITNTDENIGDNVYGDRVKTADGTNGITITAMQTDTGTVTTENSGTGVTSQISGLTLSITDSEGNVKKSANAALDDFKTTIYAKNKSESNEMTFQVGAKANQSITVGLDDMRSEALGLKGSDNTRVSVATQDKANAAVAVFDNAIQKALDQQATIGAIEARLEYTSQNLTTSSENVQAAESTIRDADMAKEMTNYTKNNVLLQAAQSMLAQANQNSSAVLSLLQ
ncbi:MAG: flagellin [Selenomonadaceae bacterium]|nr:flagellin [Selenomonadaceae bacterium]